MPREQWESLKVLSKFENAVEDFAKEQFHKGRKVIAEGIQVYDGGLWEEHPHYKDKPLIILKTNAITSVNRDKSNINSFNSFKEYVMWYAQSHKQMKDLDKSVK